MSVFSNCRLNGTGGDFWVASSRGVLAPKETNCRRHVSRYHESPRAKFVEGRLVVVLKLIVAHIEIAQNIGAFLLRQGMTHPRGSVQIVEREVLYHAKAIGGEEAVDVLVGGAAVVNSSAAKSLQYLTIIGDDKFAAMFRSQQNAVVVGDPYATEARRNLCADDERAVTFRLSPNSQ